MARAKIGDQVKIHYSEFLKDGGNHPLAGKELTFELKLIEIV